MLLDRIAPGLTARDLACMLETLPISVSALDRDWRIILANAATERYVHRSRDDLLGHPLLEALPGLRDTELYRAFDRAMTEREAATVEMPFVHNNGQSVAYEVSVFPVEAGVLCLCTDITNRREREERTSEIVGQLQRALDLASQIIEDENGAADGGKRRTAQ